MVMAVISGGRPAKRARRSNRVSADLYDFFTFPASASAADGGGGSSLPPFRDGVRSFVSSYARVTFPPSPLFSSLMTWQILLGVGDSTDGSDLSSRLVSLDVVEEDVTRSSRSVYCDHCRVLGWSGHPVCRKRYHFILRSGDSKNPNNISLQRSCSLSDSSALLADDFENWVYSLLDDDHSHLLHGVIHSNGYAHLLSLNGREGGSGFLPGRAIMDFWDRLCSWLGVRKASVMDMSRKYGMAYRLLHTVTRGHSWYGEWGYEFKSGSYALTRDSYQNAVDTLSDIPLSQFLFRGRKPITQLHSIIPFYQSLSCSELLTLRDLFSFLLRLIHNIRSKKSKDLGSASSNVLSSWTGSDVGTVQKAIIKVLKAAGSQGGRWVSRRALKGSTCRTASVDLLDYCLNHLGGEPTSDGSHIVCSRLDPGSSDLEFRLVPVNSIGPTNPCVDYLSEEHVKQDLRFLYDTLLHPQTMSKFRSNATREKMMDASTKILDCKHFIKDYQPVDVNPLAINLWCHVALSDQSKECPAPPPELLVLPMNATVSDLKVEAAKAFQEVYAMFKRFEVEELLGYGSLEDSITLKFLVGTSGKVQIKGRCSSKHGLLRYRLERGTENWKVDCICGAKDDDGESMLTCDVCGVWHHTRCAGIDNSDALPSKFHCFRCIKLYRKKSKQSDVVHDSGQVPQAEFVCRGKSVDRSNLSVTITVG